MTTTTTNDSLKERARALKLHGLLAHWDEVPEAELPWVHRLIEWEEVERKRRGLERRLSAAHIGRFKPLADFDWRWPTQCGTWTSCGWTPPRGNCWEKKCGMKSTRKAA